MFSQELTKAKTLEKLSALKQPFTNTSEDSLFVLTYSQFDFIKWKFNHWDMPSEVLEDTIFLSSVNSVWGPYENDTLAWIQKVTEVKEEKMVKVKQLYIQPQGTTSKDSTEAFKAVEGYFRKIKKGESFDTLVAKYGSPGSGELMWFGKGTMFKAFEDACFKHKKGDLFIVKTTYGAHVVEVLESPQNRRSSVTILPIILKFKE
jgi:hypothetical protein